MKVHQVFRQIQKRDTFLGLEIVDLLILLVLIGGILMFTRRLGLVVIIGGLSYVTLFFLKRGKPDKYTTHLFQYYLTPKRRHPHPENRSEP